MTHACDGLCRALPYVVLEPVELAVGRFSRNFRHDETNGQHNFANGAHANTAITPINSPTTMVGTCNPALSAPSASTAAAITANSRHTSTTTGASTPPESIGYSFIAAL